MRFNTIAKKKSIYAIMYYILFFIDIELNFSEVVNDFDKKNIQFLIVLV